MYSNIPNFSYMYVPRWGVGGTHIINCLHCSGIVTEFLHEYTFGQQGISGQIVLLTAQAH